MDLLEKTSLPREPQEPGRLIHIIQLQPRDPNDTLPHELEGSRLNDESVTTVETPSHPIYDSLPLDASKGEIRLLEVLPGGGHPPLRCKLSCAAIARA
jgi:hypothetical protein